MYKMLLLAGAAAFASSAAFAGHNVSLRASGVTGFHGVKAPVQTPSVEPGAPKCGTGFGAELPTPDGLISWSDLWKRLRHRRRAPISHAPPRRRSSKCGSMATMLLPIRSSTTSPSIRTTAPMGRMRRMTAQVVCAYTGLLGAGGGQYPTRVLAKLKLTTPCKFKAGQNIGLRFRTTTPRPMVLGNVEHSAGHPGGLGRPATTLLALTAPPSTMTNTCNSALGYTYPDYMLELH